MIRSMTGFGRCERATDQYKLSVELRAVNHRYLDLSVKMPKRFHHFESAIRNLLKDYIQRGKVDVFINYEDYTAERLCLKYNRTLAAEYVQYLKEMSEQFAIGMDLTAASLAGMPEVLTMEQAQEDEEAVWKLLSGALKEAAEALVKSRETEGAHLKADLLGKLDCMEGLVGSVEERAPRLAAEYRAKLEEKIRELLAGSAVDESRIAMEAAIFADKTCVDEETVRLRSHIGHTRNELRAGGNVGRKLDFIAQEMNREANTILSKAGDMEVSEKAIALKTEIEKVREQIQNIE